MNIFEFYRVTINVLLLVMFAGLIMISNLTDRVKILEKESGITHSGERSEFIDFFRRAHYHLFRRNKK